MEAEFVGSLLGWGLMCALCALAGKNRSIGYFWTFVLCLCLSPLIGLIIALCSKKKGTDFSEVKNTDSPTTEEKQDRNTNG